MHLASAATVVLLVIGSKPPDISKVENACNPLPIQDVTVLWWRGRSQAVANWTAGQMHASSRQWCEKAFGRAALACRECGKAITRHERSQARNERVKGTSRRILPINKTTYPWTEIPEGIRMYLMNSEAQRLVKLDGLGKPRPNTHGARRRKVLEENDPIYKARMVPLEGGLGILNGTGRIVQITGSDSAFVVWGDEWFKFVGIITQGLHDGIEFPLRSVGVFQFDGTTTYTTAAGGSNTVRVVKGVRFDEEWAKRLGIEGQWALPKR